MRAGRAIRGLRGLVGALVATFVALLSHVTAGGAMPGWVGLVVPFVLSLVVCTVLAGRRLSLVRLALAVVASQFLFHTLFVLGTFEPAAAAAVAGHQHTPGMLMPAGAAAAPASVVPADALMWGWHAFAAVVTIGALHRGERLVVRLAELARHLVAWVRRAVRAWAGVPPTSSVRRLPARIDADVRALSSVLSSSLRRRGPPRPHAI